jgi:ATP-dependent Clp protease ATP-binding subunit ClpB
MAKWQSEKSVLDNVRKIKEDIDRLKLEAEQAERSGDYGKVAEIRYGKLLEAENKLKELQTPKVEENTMLQEEVTAENIAEVVAKWTGIPVSKMMRAEQENSCTWKKN